MKQPMTHILSAVILLFAFIQTAPLYAEHEITYEKGSEIIEHVGKKKEKLDLSQEQLAALRVVDEKSNIFMRKRHEELKSIYIEADKLAQDNAIDKLKLDMLADRRAKLARETIKHQVFLKHEIYHILSLKQRMQIKEVLKNKD